MLSRNIVCQIRLTLTKSKYSVNLFHKNSHSLEKLQRPSNSSSHNHNANRIDIYNNKIHQFKFPTTVAASFHTSKTHAALPLSLLLRPLFKGVAVLTGRAVRVWWRKLTPEQKAEYIKRFRRYRHVVYSIVGLLFGGWGIYILAHLEDTPITKRKRFVAVNEEALEFMIAAEAQTILMENENKMLHPEHPYYRRVQFIINKLVKSNAHLCNIGHQWKVHVIQNDHMVNAMCLPTGDVFVFTGLLKLVENNDQLAFVLAHEMSHVLLQHGRELVSYATMLEWFLLICVASIWAFFPSDFLAVIGHKANQKLAEILLHLPYNRKLEREADVVGLEIMARGCFDVRSGPRFWELMDAYEEAKGIQVPEWLSTHPKSTERGLAVQQLLPHALEIRQECNCPPLFNTFNDPARAPGGHHFNPLVVVRQLPRRSKPPAP